MLGKTQDRELVKLREHRMDNNLLRISRLKSLITSSSNGWADYVMIIEDWLQECKRTKALTRLDQATPEQIYQLKLLDFEIYLLNRLIRTPKNVIEGLTGKIEQYRKEREEKDYDEKYS